jgi:prophage antirepressor-like protein
VSDTMMMIERFEFRGAPVVFRREGSGSWFVTARDLAAALRYESGDEVNRVYKRHQREFKNGESSTVKLTVEGSKTRKVRIFSPRGCMRVALHADTEVAEEFRDFVLDVMEKLRTGGATLVTQEQLAALMEAHRRDRASDRAHIASLERIVAGLTEQSIAHARLNEIVMSHAGKLLSFASRNPLTPAEEIERSIARELGERRKGQAFITPPPSDEVQPRAERNGGVS